MPAPAEMGRKGEETTYIKDRDFETGTRCIKKQTKMVRPTLLDLKEKQKMGRKWVMNNQYWNWNWTCTRQTTDPIAKGKKEKGNRKIVEHA
jgi:hypothetical protein